MLDFEALNSGNTTETLISPRELFNALLKNDPKYQYPRDVQAQVWSQWFDKRNEKNLIIKMNTGSGKTVVGLLILKSCLNEGRLPAVYVAPDKQLVEQVIEEANRLGLDVTENEKSTDFIRGKAILVTNIYKLINGLSVFGVGSQKIEIGSLLIDDAHACIDNIEQQFTIRIPNTIDAYKELASLFSESLKNQNEAKHYDIYVDDDSQKSMLVPFWVWQRSLPQITAILKKHKNTDELMFTLPLLEDNLNLCHCMVSANEIEISPHCIPIHMIPSIEQATRKIFMTATLVDNSILSSHFGLKKEDISKSITPETAGDIGDRMILVPKALNPIIHDNDLKSFYKELSLHHNVVVIVPSLHRASFWGDVADIILNKSNIQQGIEQLKKSPHTGLVVLINRYDGIDLPQDACRVLVIDGLPDVRRRIDEYNEEVLLDSGFLLNKRIQKIEQGMGRGIRANDDYCVVCLMGQSLVNHLYNKDGFSKLSPGTNAQMQLSEKLAVQLKSKREEWKEAINSCLKRDVSWIKASKSVLASLKYDNLCHNDIIAIGLREAYDSALSRNYEKAINIIQGLVNEENGKNTNGWLRQILAEYTNYKDQSESQKILQKAKEDNRRVLNPQHRPSYDKLTSLVSQAQNCMNFIQNACRDGDKNKVIMDLEALLDQFSFSKGSATRFEETAKNIIKYIGFDSSRPEQEGRGPDLLWTIDNEYFVIECKTECKETVEKISKDHINQLNGSANWFQSEYKRDDYCLLIIHRSDRCERAASPNSKSRVMTEEMLVKFKKSLKDCVLAIIDNHHDLKKIQGLLEHHELTPSGIIKNFTSKIQTS
ncbi:MAG: DEAD/DEAH box helicase family protein [Candidatus Margulisbacteria bacterium]|jgi:hypothetical protein|nr:DEAD/DEAH box helicase family protein [Candidatus Margulisiibacteriota bacterium]